MGVVKGSSSVPFNPARFTTEPMRILHDIKSGRKNATEALQSLKKIWTDPEKSSEVARTTIFIIGQKENLNIEEQKLVWALALVYGIKGCEVNKVYTLLKDDKEAMQSVNAAVKQEFPESREISLKIHSEQILLGVSNGEDARTALQSLKDVWENPESSKFARETIDIIGKKEKLNIEEQKLVWALALVYGIRGCEAVVNKVYGQLKDDKDAMQSVRESVKAVFPERHEFSLQVEQIVQKSIEVPQVSTKLSDRVFSKLRNIKISFQDKVTQFFKKISSFNQSKKQKISLEKAVKPPAQLKSPVEGGDYRYVAESTVSLQQARVLSNEEKSVDEQFNLLIERWPYLKSLKEEKEIITIDIQEWSVTIQNDPALRNENVFKIRVGRKAPSFTTAEETREFEASMKEKGVVNPTGILSSVEMYIDLSGDTPKIYCPPGTIFDQDVDKVLPILLQNVDALEQKRIQSLQQKPEPLEG